MSRARRRRLLLLLLGALTLLGLPRPGQANPPADLAPPYAASDHSHGCGPARGACTADSAADHTTGTLTVAANIVSPDNGTAPGWAAAVADASLTARSQLDEAAAAVDLTIRYTIHQAHAHTAGQGWTDTTLHVSAASDTCAASGCTATTAVNIVGATNTTSHNRADETAEATVRLINASGGNLPAGPLAIGLQLHTSARLGDVEDRAGTVDTAATIAITGIQLAAHPALQPYTVTATADYLTSGTYTGAATPNPCNPAAPTGSLLPGVVCIPVPDGATAAQLVVDDATGRPIGAVARPGGQPNGQDTRFCRESPAIKLWPAAAQLAVFLDGPANACGSVTTIGTTGTVTAHFTLWRQPAA